MSISASEELRAAQALAGRLIQNFATIELLVGSWILKLEESDEVARVFLKRNRPIAARIQRLASLLRTAGDVPALSLATLLAQLDGLRNFRNQYVHGAGGIDEDDQLVLVGWRGLEPFSLEAMERHVDHSVAILQSLDDAFKKRFSEAPSFQIVIKAAPPPTE